jgi:YVTN family beta-propeller protein
MTLLHRLLALAALCLPLASCSPDEPLINSFNDTYRVLFAAAEPGLSVAQMPSTNIVDADLYRTLSGASQTTPYVRMVQYRDEIFCVKREGSTIDVLSQRADTLLRTIDCSPYGRMTDICFVNATTAYATHPDSNVVSVIDLTVDRAVMSIKVGATPIGICSVGNQVCVANQADNTVTIIDSRTNTPTATLNVSAAPTYMGGDAERDQCVVVCLGEGKVDTKPKTTPRMAFVNVVKKQVTTTLDLTNRPADGPNLLPGGLVVTVTGSALVPCQQGLLRVLTSTRNKVSLMQFDPYTRIGYNAARAEILCVGADGVSTTIFDEYGEVTKASLTAPATVGALLGLAP